MLSLVLVASFVVFVSSNNIASIENQLDGSLLVSTPNGKPISIQPGVNGNILLDGVPFTKDELTLLKKLVTNQAIADRSLGSALSPGEAGVSLKNSSLFLGATEGGKTYFVTPKTYTIKQASVNGRRVWDPATLDVNVGDTVTWIWTSQESVSESNDAYDPFDLTNTANLPSACKNVTCFQSPNGGYPVFSSSFNFTFMEGPSKRFYVSRNSQTMQGVINVKANSFARDSINIATHLNVSGDLTLNGNLISNSTAVYFSQVDALLTDFNSRLSGAWGGPGKTLLRDWLMTTYQVVSSINYGNGWRCGSPVATCPNPKKMIAGGCEAVCYSSYTDQGIAQTSNSGNGWTCGGYTYQYMTAYAMCI